MICIFCPVDPDGIALVPKQVSLVDWEVELSKSLSVLDYIEDPTISIAVPIQFISQSAFTCSKLEIETLEKGVKYVQS